MHFALLLIPFVRVEGFGFSGWNVPRLPLNRVGIIRNTLNSYEIKAARSIRLSPIRLFSSEADDGFAEDLTYLNDEFDRLADGREYISFQDFLGSEAIQAILTDEDADDYLTDIRDIWLSQAKSLDTSIDLDLFVSINRQIDDLFEYVDEDEEEDPRIGEDDEENAESENGIRRLADIIEGRNSNTEEEESGEIIEVRDIDIWDPEFNVKEYFGLDFLKYLKRFYDANTDDKNKGLLSFSSFVQWADVKNMLADGEIDAVCLVEVWGEAIAERNSRRKGGEEEAESKGFKVDEDAKKGFLDFDSFTRMNVRLDVVLEEVKDALGNLTDQEVEDYYRAEFLKLGEGEDLISYSQLLAWTDIQQLMEEGGVSEEQFSAMWDALPKKPLGTFVKKQNKSAQSDGISVESFLLFNSGLEDFASDSPSGDLSEGNE